MDLFLKAASEPALYAALVAAELAVNIVDTDGNVVGRQISPAIALDVIGTIYEPTGVVETIDGEQIPQTAALDGFHANLRGTLTPEQEALLPLIAAPSNPVRVWA